MSLRSAARRWGSPLLLPLFIVALVSCNSTAGTTEPTVTPPDMLTTPQYMTVAPPSCYGMFVDMRSKPNVTSRRPGTADRLQTAYKYKVGEPIAVTNVILVFGEGGIALFPEVDPLRSHIITIIDEQGREIPLTYSHEIISRRGANVVDKDGPYIESFRIDDWFDLSEPGRYTLTMTRKVYVSGTPQMITGNPIVFYVYQPPAEGRSGEQPGEALLDDNTLP